jgi:methylglutaconyl-CoA hydratase
MQSHVIEYSLELNGIANITLNKPEKRNTYDEVLMNELHELLRSASANLKVRALVLRGKGSHFQAGADLAWLQKTLLEGEPANRRFADLVVATMRLLTDCPVPTVALVQGACLGGGMGLAASCDFVIAASDAVFGLPEVRAGLSAASIFPQLVAAIGLRSTKYIALSGDRIGADEAHRIGLAHSVCRPEELEGAGARLIDSLLHGGPDAVRLSKRLLSDLARSAQSELVSMGIAKAAADGRRNAEVIEGLESFLQKRNPVWYSGELAS